MKLKATGDVNHREGAGTSYKVIQVIPKGTTVEWLGYSFVGSLEWKLVKYNGKLGFASARYLKEV